MGLLEQLKTNSSTFHLRSKKEIDILFAEMEEMGQYLDSQLDFLIRMSIQKLKLQLYYLAKLDDYRSKPISLKAKVSDKEVNTLTFNESTKKKGKKKKKNKQNKINIELTKEQLIAANKARVSKFHPEPDFSTISPHYRRALQKLEFEKEMNNRTKNKWVSVVSIPMGGKNK